MFLPAIAMVAPLGVVLDANRSPAKAATYHFTASTASGVVLQNYPGYTQFQLDNTFTISNGSLAVAGNGSQTWTFTNDGSVNSTGSFAIYFSGAGTVINNSGHAITGARGVNIAGLGGSVNNAGQIVGGGMARSFSTPAATSPIPVRPAAPITASIFWAPAAPSPTQAPSPPRPATASISPSAA